VAAAVALYLTVVINSSTSTPKAPLKAKEAVAASASFRRIVTKECAAATHALRSMNSR
jgi:hypothetical protein